MRIPDESSIDRLSWPVRTLLGCVVAVLSIGLTYVVPPLRATPLLIGFPTVILSAWFFGMAGSFGCALTDSILVDVLLTKAQFRFSIGFVQQEQRLGVFLILSTLVGVLIRRWAEQGAELRAHELRKSLILEQTQRQMAEERARAGEELRDRDAALQIALRASGMGLWTWDLQENRVHWSDEVYRILGYAPGQFPPENEIWLSAIHPEDEAEVRAGVAHVIANGSDFHRQYRILSPEGATRWVESQGRCLLDSAGQATWVMGVLTDVTHRKRTEEAMLRAEKLAVAGRLAASVAHEINNPLEAVTNLLYLISMSTTAEEAQTHARSALDEIVRVSMITQSTLKFHRQQGQPKTTMLSEVLESVVMMFRPRLISAGISLEVQPVDEVAITCMPGEAQQIFTNLISNSIEATRQPGKMVIRLRRSRDWRNRSVTGMRVTIRDSGVGMDRLTTRRIFEPFFTTKPETGTGLGMWVVAQLVERHRGSVRVWSTQRYGASGTVFSIFLPMAHPSEAMGVDVDTSVLRALPIEVSPADSVV